MSISKFSPSSLTYGTTLLIDELDAKLHPMLLQYVIRLFTDMSINKRGGQLIFTSHDLSTMNNDVFRRDEIWFVAKGRGQNSGLYSLVEFKNDKGESVRKDAKYDKQYLEGKYGADPYLKKILNYSIIRHGVMNVLNCGSFYILLITHQIIIGRNTLLF